MIGRRTRKREVRATSAELGLPATWRVRDLWEMKDLGDFTASFAASNRSRGAGLYRVSPSAQ